MWQLPRSYERPTWLKCGFEHWAMVFTPWKKQERIYDYSIARPHNNYRSFFLGENLNYHGYKPEVFTKEPINRWFTPRWVEPIYVSHSPSGDVLNTFSRLFRLLAASAVLYFRRPQESRPVPIAIRSCLSYPYSILAGSSADLKITNLGHSYEVHCSKCILTNCIDHQLTKSYSRIVILRRPSYVMLPVDLKNDAWFDNEAL